MLWIAKSEELLDEGAAEVEQTHRKASLIFCAEGPALQPAIGLFFAGGKEAVEIDVQLLREGGLPHLRTIANI